MHQNRFRLGAYSAPPDPLAVFKGTYFQGEGGGRGREEGKGRGRKGKGRERENDLTHPLSQIAGYATA